MNLLSTKQGQSWAKQPVSRDATGAITGWVPNALPCFCGGKHLYRDCPITSAWDKTPNGKWHWNGGKGWKSGCPPANYTGPGATQAKSAADAPKQAAKVVTLSSFMSDSDIAARLTERWEGSAGDVHVGQPTGQSSCLRPDVHGDPNRHASRHRRAPPSAPRPTSSTWACSTVRRRSVVSVISSVSSFCRAHFRNFFFLAAFVGLVSMAFYAGLQMQASPAGGPMAAMVNISSASTSDVPWPVNSSKLTGNHTSYVVNLVRATPSAASSRFTMLYAIKAMLFAVLAFLYWHTEYLYVLVTQPIDVLRSITYCLLAPLAVFPAAYRAVLGLGRGQSSFYIKTVGALQRIGSRGWPFALLVAVAIGLSRFSPLDSSPTSNSISAPAFPDASTAPGLTDIALPYRGAWLPREIDSGGGVVHSYNSALVAEGETATESDPNVTSVTASTICGNSSKNDSSLSKVISSLPFVFCTIDSGCSAHCTALCSLLVNTTPCNEVFGAANGVLSRATLIGSLPIVARTSDGKFIHFVVTNVRCVPSFSDFTLLSVDQLWEEQRIRSLFCDEKKLQLPDCSGGQVVPFDQNSGRNTVKLASAVQLYDQGLISRPAAKTQQSALLALGFHDIKSVAHVARLSASQVGELMHRRLHRPVNVVRAAAHLSADAPPNLARAENFSCSHCAAANITKASHGDSKTTTIPSTLPPATAPGTLHIDLKGIMVRAVTGAQYAIFATDEYSRFVFVEYLKSKETREQIAAVSRIISRFNKLVDGGTDDNGRPLPKPNVTVIRSDHEAALESALFESFRAHIGIASVMSPPYDHDLNPIAERTIGVVSTLAAAMKGHCNASATLWPWLIENAVNVHNSTGGKIGSSTADPLVTAHERLTRTRPSIMDLATLGSRAVVLVPPPLQKKGDLSSRGWVGSLLGRRLGGCTNEWDVLAEGRIVHSSSVQVDEENLPFWKEEAHHRLQPTQPTTRAPVGNDAQNTSPGGAAGQVATSIGNLTSSISSLSNHDSLCALNLFSGPYARAEGLSARLAQFGWHRVINIDNDPDTCGGWKHDLFNDELFAQLLTLASNGTFDAMMVAFPCSTYSAARLFSSDPPGPPPVRTKSAPDGLDPSVLDPRHVSELNKTNLLLDRTFQLCVAARKSTKKTTIILENPADKSVRGTLPFAEDCVEHGSLWATSAFDGLKKSIPDSSMVTFAYCRFDSDYQKYTTLWYTNESGPVLDQLGLPLYQCNHSKHNKVAGGRLPDGTWASASAAPYPSQLCTRLGMALTSARTGDSRPLSDQRLGSWTSDGSGSDVNVHAHDPASGAGDSRVEHGVPAPPSSPSPQGTVSRFRGSPLPPFPDLSVSSTLPSTSVGGTSVAPVVSSPLLGRVPPPVPGRSERVTRPGVRREGDTSTYDQQLRDLAAKQDRARVRRAGRRNMSPVAEHDESPYDTYEEFNLGEAAAEVASMVFDANYTSHTTEPIGLWIDAKSGARVPSGYFDEVDGSHSVSRGTAFTSVGPDRVKSLPPKPPSRAAASGLADEGTIETEDLIKLLTTTELESLIMNTKGIPEEVHHSLFAALQSAMYANSPDADAVSRHIDGLQSALRADSDGAPSNHTQAVAAGPEWIEGERIELGNHDRNKSWRLCRRRDVPNGRRLHKFVWVYKIKRNGEVKVRLCVQGCTLEAGIDFDQTFSSTLRHSSARALFAHAARCKCQVRSIDFVSAYLQGSFLEGEKIYCHMPDGYQVPDADGKPMVCVI